MAANADPSLNATDDFYNGKYIYFTSGDQAGRRALITDYVAATRTFTLSAGDLAAAPGTGASFVVETHDTGRSQLDNITRDDTPVIRFRLDDATLIHDIQGNPVDGNNNPPDQLISIPFDVTQTSETDNAGFRVPVFIEGTPQHSAGQLPQVLVGYARQLVEGVYEFDFGSDAIDFAADATGNTLGAFSLASNNGSYFISAKVEIIDPSDADNATAGIQPGQTGFAARSDSLEIVVDTFLPPVSFGDPIIDNDGLRTDSDTGVSWMPSTYVDRITSDTSPTFWGVAEADSIVALYIDVNADGALDSGDYFVGRTVAVPFDGTNQYPTGQWELTSVVDMNDPRLLDALGNNDGDLTNDARDGVRRILAVTEDVAGNVSTPAEELQIFIDTQGPQITDVDINNLNNPYDLFDPKPSEDGPTPLVDSLVVSLQDLPNRADLPAPLLDFLQAALKTMPEAGDPLTGVSNGPVALEEGYFSVIGDYNGIIPIDSITFTSDGDLTAVGIQDIADGAPATGYITINFVTPLPDDRYTLSITDDLVDYSGNHLDGESHAVEPHDVVTFPTGDGVPGGDFAARFTVDSRPEVGVWGAGSVWVDTNGNWSLDPDNLDFTNRDIIYALNNGSGDNDQLLTTDDVFAGNFAGPGPDNQFGTPDDEVADGFDKLAAYGRLGGGGDFRWLVDTTNNGVPNINVVEPRAINGRPVAGNFDGDPTNGDEVGLFTGRGWWFDTTHDYQLNEYIPSRMVGYPIVGDFDGDGHDDLGTWSDDRFQFTLSAGMEMRFLNDRSFTAQINFGFIGTRERPVAADIDQDGIDDIGLWVPDRTGVSPNESSEWYFLISNDHIPDVGLPNRTNGSVVTLSHEFEPVPFGHDLYASFGNEFALPVIGNFDPPVTPANATGEPSATGHTNFDNPRDVNADGLISPVDALIVINDLNSNGARELVGAATEPPYLDVNMDGLVSPSDILIVINHLNQVAEAENAEGEADAPVLAAVQAAPATADNASAAQESVASQSTDDSAVDAAIALISDEVQVAKVGTAFQVIDPRDSRLDDVLDSISADVTASQGDDDTIDAALTALV